MDTIIIVKYNVSSINNIPGHQVLRDDIRFSRISQFISFSASRFTDDDVAPNVYY